MDEQAGFEKILNAVLPAISHADLIAAAGMLDGSMLASMEQLVLDNEMLGSIFRIGRGISVTDNTLAMDVITRVGPGGDYLLDPHTSENLRDEHYISDLCFRAGNTSWGKAGYKTIHDAAEGTVTGILDTHTPAILDSKITAEIGSIIRKAGDGHE
jgi:trimethylamine--corrinoid protein Co-methyltransferase